MQWTRVARHVDAPRSVVYQALLNAQAIARWRVPDGMSSHVHEVDARVGGRLRVSLRYDQRTGTGKSTEHSDTYHGYFADNVAGRLGAADSACGTDAVPSGSWR